MPILYESYQDNPGAYFYERSFQQGQGMGWPRTVLLGIGAAAGVLGTAGLIHMAKGGKPGEGPRGWTRTAILSAGALGGTLVTAGIIHLAKAPEAPEALSLVEEV